MLAMIRHRILLLTPDRMKGLSERILAQVCRPASVKSYGIVATSLRSD